MQPPSHIIPSIKLNSALPFFNKFKDFLMLSTPSETIPFATKSTFCSSKASLTAIVKPPHLAKPLPKDDAQDSNESSSSSLILNSLASNNACNSSNVMTESTYFVTLSSLISSFLAVHGPIKITFEFG